MSEPWKAGMYVPSPQKGEFNQKLSLEILTEVKPW